MSDEEDDTLESFLRSKSGGDRRRSRRPSPRRGSSPYLSEGHFEEKRRRLSSMTTSSGDETAISIDEAELTEEEVLENMRLHKQIIETIKTQPWRMKKKYKALRRAKAYVQKHEGELAHSKRSKDIVAKYTIMMGRTWQRFKRELANFMVTLTPWEMRIKKIESHFGSVVASYFLFLRWVFWVNLFITTFVCCFLMVPEVLRGDDDPTGMRKEVESEEKDSALNLQAIWDFEGYLKYSPIFYGYYSNREKTAEGYRLPLAYFLTSLSVYIFSFFCILRRMAENSRMSKMSEKDDECTFTWKIFTGWDFMIGNAETAYNKTASLIMGFKESILEEQERKKEDRNWKTTCLRILANFAVLVLLLSSAYAVVLVVQRSQQPDAESSWYRQNEVTLVVSAISIVFPNLFDMIGLMERHHPRVQLQWQLARILVLYLLNLYTLIFALFAKVLKMTKELDGIRLNITSLNLMDMTTPEPELATTTELTVVNATLQTVLAASLTRIIRSAGSGVGEGSSIPQNCSLLILHNCTLATLKRSQGDLFSLNASIILDIIASSSKYMDQFGPMFNKPSDPLPPTLSPEVIYNSVFWKVANFTAVAFANWSTGATGIRLPIPDKTDPDPGGGGGFFWNLMNYSTPDWLPGWGRSGEASSTPEPTPMDLDTLLSKIANYTAEGFAEANVPSGHAENVSDALIGIISDMTRNWTRPPTTPDPETVYTNLLYRIANYTAIGLTNWTSGTVPNDTSVAGLFGLMTNGSSEGGGFYWPPVLNDTDDMGKTPYYTEVTSDPSWTDKGDGDKGGTDNCTVVFNVCPDMFPTGTTLFDKGTYGPTGPDGNKTSLGPSASPTLPLCSQCRPDFTDRIPRIEELVRVEEEVKDKLRKLCWETMFGQELVKLTVMDLVMTIISTLVMDFIRALFVRYANRCWCWDLEKNFPGYGDFKIAENILHLVNNQGMIWMGMFFSPGLPALNTVKLCIMMYVRSWAVLTCNIPHETVFKASGSNNFYFALLLIMLFLCTLPVGYACVWLQPSWHCGPFSGYTKIYKVFTNYLKSVLPSFMNVVLEYVASPGVVIPLFLLLVLIIYYLVSLTGSLRESNNDLRTQLRRERDTEKRPSVMETGDRGESAEVSVGAGGPAGGPGATAKWTKASRIQSQQKDDEIIEEKKNGRGKKVQYRVTSEEDEREKKSKEAFVAKLLPTLDIRAGRGGGDQEKVRIHESSQDSQESQESRASNSDVPIITISHSRSVEEIDQEEEEEEEDTNGDKVEQSEEDEEEEERSDTEEEGSGPKSQGDPTDKGDEKKPEVKEEEGKGKEEEGSGSSESSSSSSSEGEEEGEKEEPREGESPRPGSRPPMYPQTSESFRTHAASHSRSESPALHPSAAGEEGPVSESDSETTSGSTETSNGQSVRGEEEEVEPVDGSEAVRRANIQRLATDSL